LAVALAAGVVFVAGYSPNARADQCGGADGTGTYQELIDAGSCTIGDKTFSDFTFGFTGTPALTASDINFSIINGVGGEWGFRFQFSLNVAGNATKDIGLGYVVSCTDGSACIDSIHGVLTGFVSNGGFATVGETFVGPGGTPAGGFGLSWPGAVSGGADITPTVSLTTTKDINVTCEFGSAGCFASISIVTNTVDQVTVPEPGTLSLLAAGLLGLGWVGRRRDRS
jgi:hypothetical protein